MKTHLDFEKFITFVVDKFPRRLTAILSGGVEVKKKMSNGQPKE